MSSIMDSLGKVSDRLSEEAFLSNKGLSNEVGIHVFCYAPEQEMTVRAYFDTLKGKTGVPYRLIERDLYRIFLEICEEKRILKSIPGMEERKGREYLSEQLEKILSYIDIGTQEGAEHLIGGERNMLEGELPGGYYVKPTVFKGHHKMRIFQDEIFGPVLAVTTFKDHDEALSIANETLYSLGAGVWTRDINTAYRFSRGIQAGRV